MPDHLALAHHADDAPFVVDHGERAEAETIYYIFVTEPSDDRLLGVLVLRNLVLSRPGTLVRDLMVADVVKVRATADREEAARLLDHHHLLALPVVDDDRRLVGMVSEREVIRHLLTTQVFSGADVRSGLAPGIAPRAVRDVMSRQVMCVAPEQPIAEVASLMSNKEVDRVPVVREGQLVGFLTRGDIVRKLIGN